ELEVVSLVVRRAIPLHVKLMVSSGGNVGERPGVDEPGLPRYRRFLEDLVRVVGRLCVGEGPTIDRSRIGSPLRGGAYVRRRSRTRKQKQPIHLQGVGRRVAGGIAVLDLHAELRGARGEPAEGDFLEHVVVEGLAYGEDAGSVALG